MQRNLEAVQLRIRKAAEKSGRDPKDINLVVVTKGHPASVIQAAYELGVREIGESYVEEGQEKRESLGLLPEMKWHMIGHIQTRKVKMAAAHFDMIQSVDSLKLAKKLDRFAADKGHVLPILLECNVSGETSKYGWVAWEEREWAKLLQDIGEVLKLLNVKVHGLMSMAPYLDNMEKARPFFVRTRKLRDYFANQFPSADWSQLSMGMSGDFEAGILEGATIVRIGTAIVGPRPV